MKPFLVFGGDWYKPSGGMEDFEGDFNSFPEAQRRAERFEWAHIVLRDDIMIVATWEAGSEWDLTNRNVKDFITPDEEMRNAYINDDGKVVEL